MCSSTMLASHGEAVSDLFLARWQAAETRSSDYNDFPEKGTLTARRKSSKLMGRPAEGWDRVLSLNVKSIFYMTSLLTPLLAKDANNIGKPAPPPAIASFADRFSAPRPRTSDRHR